MVFASALFVQAVLASAVFAIPSSKARLAERVARRRAGHQSRPNKLVSNATHEEYSENWAGAVYDSYPAGTFTAVTGTFTVPTPSVPSGGSGTYSSSAWVGIDGDTCGSAILQTGLDFTADDSGDVSYDAWYEWFPAGAYDFDGISFSPGDSVTVTVTSSSTTSGVATIENNSNGQSVTQQLSSSSALCQQNAEWIVEDYEEGGGLVPFANFGTVTFTGASATTTSGAIGPGSATIIDIEQNGQQLTSSSVDDSSVTVTYQ